MKRVIRFRVWDIQNERMVYDPDRFEPSYSEDEKVISPWVFYETWQDREDGIGRSCQLMQFTGLLDKNGKEIWEGDFVTFSVRGDQSQGYEERYYQRGQVKIGNGLSVAYGAWQFQWCYDVKVIGNIYESPDLLK